MSGRARSPSQSPNPPTPTEWDHGKFMRRPKGRRRGSRRCLACRGQPNVPESFDTQPIKTLVIITCHSDACECVSGQCFRPIFKTPYDLLFTSNYGCPTITYGSFFDIARNLFGNIRSSIVRTGDAVNGDVLTRAIYSTVSVINHGKTADGEWLGAIGTLGRSTNLRFHKKNEIVSNLTMFGPGTSEARNVNGVYVFPVDKDGIPRLRDDDDIRGYNILNKPEVLAELGIKKNPDTSTEVRPGLFHYPNSTYSRTGRGVITLEYLLDGVKKLKEVDVVHGRSRSRSRSRSTFMIPSKGTLVIPLTCRILEGAQREGMPLVSPTLSQFSEAMSPLGHQVDDDKDGDEDEDGDGKDDFDDLFGSGGGGGSGGGSGGGGKTRRHIRHKLTKKYRPNMRSRSRSRLLSRSKPKSTRKKSRK